MLKVDGTPGSLDRGLKKTVDWWLIGCYLLLVFIGWINIYASIHSTEPASIFDWSARSGKQAIWILTAFALDLMILFVINPRLWEVLSSYAYIVVFFLLVLVIFFLWHYIIFGIVLVFLSVVLGARYSFRGPDINTNVNAFMNKAQDKAASAVEIHVEKNETKAADSEIPADEGESKVE